MTTLDLLTDLRARGVLLTVRGDRLAYDAPVGVVTPDLRELLKAHKAALLAILVDSSPPRPIPATEGPQTHADAEWRRFLSVRSTRPDNRGWYDPAVSWPVIQHLDAAGRAMAARKREE